jgi:predicted alpha/beta hydrolase
MKVEDLSLPARDGMSLAATIFRPDNSTQCNPFVLITSAVGVKRAFYKKFATYLCDQGFSVLSFDYRGIGDSRPKSLFRFKATMSDWGEKDVAGMIDWIATEHAHEKLMVVGHSVGAQLVGIAPNNEKIAAMLSIAGQSGYWGLWSSPRKYLMAALWYLVVPSITPAITYFPARRLGLGEDLPGGVILEWARWCRNPNYIVDDAGKPKREHFETFKAPILYYSFADDIYAPQAAVEHLMSFYTSAAKSGRHILPSELGLRSIGHFGFFREKMKPLLWAEASAWLMRQS